MIIRVRVRPGFSKQEVIKIGDREFIVLLKERAENNEANLGLVRVLKKYFKGIFNETYYIKIIKGLKGRNKIVEVIKNGDKI